MSGQPVPTGVVVDDAELSELPQPGVERARVGVARVLKGAKRQRVEKGLRWGIPENRQRVTAEFPQHA